MRGQKECQPACLPASLLSQHLDWAILDRLQPTKLFSRWPAKENTPLEAADKEQLCTFGVNIDVVQVCPGAR